MEVLSLRIRVSARILLLRMAAPTLRFRLTMEFRNPRFRVGSWYFRLWIVFNLRSRGETQILRFWEAALGLCSWMQIFLHRP